MLEKGFRYSAGLHEEQRNFSCTVREVKKCSKEKSFSILGWVFFSLKLLAGFVSVTCFQTYNALPKRSAKHLFIAYSEEVIYVTGQSLYVAMSLITYGSNLLMS